MLHMPENISSKEVRPKPPVVTASYLHSFLKDQGTNPWLPFLLFAYREVPLPLTGFSPYKLLYGWDVHGPLDLHSKGWESPSSTRSDKGVVQYVLEMKHHLARHCKKLGEHVQGS